MTTELLPGSPEHDNLVPCPECRGTGRKRKPIPGLRLECHECDGRGTMPAWHREMILDRSTVARLYDIY